jgi:aconitate hydratase
MEAQRIAGEQPAELKSVLSRIGDAESLLAETQFGSCLFAMKPGDGSAREQAASCQKVLGGFANICYSYATKRYRSNCINWGILPFTLEDGAPFTAEVGDYVFVPNVRALLESGAEDFPAVILFANGEQKDITLSIKGLTDDETAILLQGCLMNYYAAQAGQN